MVAGTATGPSEADAIPDGPGAASPGIGTGVEAPEAALDALVGCREPFLIGVRHHSPALAAAMPELLAAAAPELLFVELPEEFAPWIAHLADPATVPPVALAGTGPYGQVFLPFADFSPELAAIRWARAANVPVIPFDLPLAARATPPVTRGAAARAEPAPPDAEPRAAGEAEARGRMEAQPEAEARPGRSGEARSLAQALRARTRGRPDDDLWDRLIEATAPGGTAESLRRAALLVGWALRHDAAVADLIDPHDLRREAHMRRRLAEHPGVRAVALVGAFHGPALLPSGVRQDPAAGTVEAPSDRTAACTVEAPSAEAPDTQSGAPPSPVPALHPSVPADEPVAVAVPAPGLAAPGATPAVPAPKPDAPGAGPTGPDGRALPYGDPDAGEVVTSLVPYTHALLDERSGYPAGIRDPEWQQGVLQAAGDIARLDALLIATAVRICVAVRAAGHPCGPPDAREVVRLARDLAALRGLPAAGRGELVEAAQTALTHGRLLGRGRVVAEAMEEVLVGNRHGRLAPGTPRSGLGPAVEARLAALGLPGPPSPARRELRLDPLRSDLDRRREVCLRRLSVCRVPYGRQAAVAGTGDAAAVTTRWTVEWTPAAVAMLDVAGVHGPDLGRAAGGLLRQRRRTERRQGGPTAAQVLAGLDDAAHCGLPALSAERLAETAALLPQVGTLPELIAGMDLLDRLRAGHVPGLPAGWESAALVRGHEELAAAGVRALDGLAGSTSLEDARALVELATRAERSGGGLRLADALARLDTDGTPLVRGAAGAARVLLGRYDAAGFGRRLAARADGATTAALRADLASFLGGALTAAGPLLEAGPALGPLVDCVEDLRDQAFLDRLPALRGGFDTLSPAARDRLLYAVEERLGSTVGALPASADPGVLARLAAADLAGHEALAVRGLLPPPGDGTVPRPAVAQAADSPGASHAVPAARTRPGTDRTLAPADRWRLLLGRTGGRTLPGPAARIATALDELYGAGRGEGAGSGWDGTGRGGDEPAFPDTRSWAEELAVLFGPGVREEVLAAAADAGRVEAALELDPASARPSVELLRTVLSYAGGLPEQRLARLRPLVARLVKELTEALAGRLRPALTGLSHPRPTRRPGGPLDLPGTLRANLASARRDPRTGAVTVLPEHPVFRTRARKAADWRLVLVVDVSGSMEASTIWSALTASVLAGVPALSTHFVAFSTEVLDLTGHVADPLSLLLEVRVGGGTNIARGLHRAHELVTVPSRTLVVLVSDFEEGGPVGPLLAEVRALVDAGCHVLGCASLDDAGRPRYSAAVAGQVVAAGMPVAALSPLELARWVGERIGGTHR